MMLNDDHQCNAFLYYVPSVCLRHDLYEEENVVGGVQYRGIIKKLFARLKVAFGAEILRQLVWFRAQGGLL